MLGNRKWHYDVEFARVSVTTTVNDGEKQHVVMEKEAERYTTVDGADSNTFFLQFLIFIISPIILTQHRLERDAPQIGHMFKRRNRDIKKLLMHLKVQ